jgi:hypothetical protein
MFSLNRSYTITNGTDVDHILNGRCPSYSLTWGSKNHIPYWHLQHDYFIGNGENINDGTQELREILSKRLSNGIITKHIIFCELDDVLFQSETLSWCPKGKELWAQIRKYYPILLTSSKNTYWHQKELGEDVQIITCCATEKINYCLNSSILIDDKIDNLKLWNEKGGKFILYDEEYLNTIAERIERHMESDLPSP